MAINLTTEYPKLESELQKLRFEHDKLKEDNAMLLEALKGLPKLLNAAADSLEAQAKRENMLNTLVEPLRKFANAIQVPKQS